MKKAATFIKEVNPSNRGTQRLYRMDPPLADYGLDDSRSYEYVVVSAASVMGVPETYIFPSNEDGRVTGWSELPGSIKGTLSHEEALDGAGYTVRP